MWAIGTAGVVTNNVEKPYTNNGVNQYTGVGGDPVTNGPAHQITAYDGNSYAYIGDTYLAQVTSGGTTYQLRYDALGRCVQRTLGGTISYFLFDGEHWILEYNASGADVGNALYGLGIDEIIARSNNGQGQFLMQDRLGNTSLVLGGSGQVLESYTYDAFGTPAIKAPSGAGREVSAIKNNFLFTGREYAPQFGIYEYRNRAYHPGLGRFTSEDPIGIKIAGAKPSPELQSMLFAKLPETFAESELNLFAYCNNDPLNRLDPWGLEYIKLELIKTGDRN